METVTCKVVKHLNIYDISKNLMNQITFSDIEVKRLPYKLC